jgi:hypothetical protein
MNRMRKLLLSAGLVLAGVSVCAWQDSSTGSMAAAAEKARREREARKGQKVKSYTEADLKGSGASGALSSEAAQAGTTSEASPAPGAKKAEKTDDEIRADKKKDFEKRIAEQVRLMDVIKKAMDEAQTELNDASTSTLFGSRRAALQKRLDDGEVELAKARQAIADVEEEARRQGISVSRP